MDNPEKTCQECGGKCPENTNTCMNCMEKALADNECFDS